MFTLLEELSEDVQVLFFTFDDTLRSTIFTETSIHVKIGVKGAGKGGQKNI